MLAAIGISICNKAEAQINDGCYGTRQHNANQVSRQHERGLKAGKHACGRCCN